MKNRRLQYERLERRDLLAADLEALLWASLPQETRDELTAQLSTYYAVHESLPGVEQSAIDSLEAFKNSLGPVASQLVRLDAPYAQDFSLGMPGHNQGWVYSSTSGGRIEVVAGRLRMDSKTRGGYDLNSATLFVDLPSQSRVYLSGQHWSLKDEDHEQDGIFFSSDGINWTRREVTQGRFDFLVPTGTTQIKFQQYDNWPAPYDGREWDDIRVEVVPDGVVRYAADMFVDGGAYLSNISVRREAELLGWTTETILTRSVTRTRNEIERLLDDTGTPRYPVLFVNGGKANSHGRALGAGGRQTIVDFVHAGGSYVGSCAGAFLAGDYARDVLHLWPGATGVNRSGSQSVSFADTPDHPIAQALVAAGITDMIVRGIPQRGGPRYSPSYSHPEGTEFLGKIISASSSIRNTVGTYYLVEYQPTPTSGVLMLASGHLEYAYRREHTILNAAILQYARDRSQVSHNVELASLPVAESESNDWITVESIETVDVDSLVIQPMPTQVEPAREDVFATMAETKREPLALRQFRPEAVDAVFGPMLI